jgi:hypothetical protein
MPVNLNKPDRWKKDISQSVDFYNKWFMEFAPKTFRESRKEMTELVKGAVVSSNDLYDLNPEMLKAHPVTLSMLRMATAPPIARDRLVGLANVPKSLVNRMEKVGKLPVRMSDEDLDLSLTSILEIIDKLLDRDIFTWLETNEPPTERQRERAATIVADRLTGATADPIIRNAQEQRQLSTIGEFLKANGYNPADVGAGREITDLEPGTFTFRYNVVAGGKKKVNIPIDAIVQPKVLRDDRLPILIEAKSAGDFTNTNKRRKEEATKMRQLKDTYGDEVPFILFLNGYFDGGYLGYEAAEGIDWVWEHRVEDLSEFGI